ncbi:hypothetical protein SAY86_010430 [Trapa natans]|uniref:BHLH domain-containing protein n=1 Tax=Trapa natans TaxID=22666 RepID=A0AAN7LH36_TRANT|nr:hypothetical protein SAY86_010430 [Trapa natans]
MNESSVGNNMWSKSVAKYDHRPRPLSSNSLLGSLQSGNGLEEGTRARTSNSMRLLPSSLPLQSQTPSGNNTSAMMNSSYAPPCSTSAPQKRIVMLAAPDGKSSREPISVKKSGTVVKGDSLEEDKQSWQSSRTTKGGGSSDGEKTLEPVGGSSSVCSGNDVGGACDDMKHIFKRKYHETDSEGCSEDVEEESVSAKRQAAGPDIPRRTRAAEVHSQSERRRRDRINEKMRTLKELIPNCNKVDKASMLDEVIEYIKTLKLQLQMVTMGAGTCMMPTILSTVMQHVGHVPYFPTNMGMSMIPAMHGMVSPMNDLPGQGFALPMPCTPLVPFSGAVIELPKGPNNACGVPMHAENQDLSMVSNGINSVRGNGKQSGQNTACLTEKRQNSQCAGATSTGKVSDKMCTGEITDCISGEDHPKTPGM